MQRRLACKLKPVCVCVVKGNMWRTASVRAARTALWTVWVTMNTCVSQSMCSHVWEREHDFSHEPHVMWDTCVPLFVHVHVHACVHMCVHVCDFVSEYMYACVCVEGHLPVKHTGTHCLLSEPRLGSLLRWPETWLDHIKSASTCAENKKRQKRHYE